jgi:signal transduction histidine kinase
MENNYRKLQMIFGIIGGCTFLFIIFSLGYFVSNLIFSISLKNMGIFNYLITVFCSLLVFGTMVVLRNILVKYTKFGNKENHRFLNSKIEEALDRIAHGDFNVFIQIEEHDFHNDIAISVNKMAKELGSMETLRQDFISNVSHEIGSPLTSIKGFALLLKNDKLSSEERSHYIDIIEQ